MAQKTHAHKRSRRAHTTLKKQGEQQCEQKRVKTHQVRHVLAATLHKTQTHSRTRVARALATRNSHAQNAQREREIINK